MTDLRRISVDESTTTAGVLPDYRLAFNIPGWGESAVSGMAAEGRYLHGVLYFLTPAQFAVVSVTEGVPFAYQWERSPVVPYRGNGNRAGAEALEANVEPVSAFLLTANRNKKESYSAKWYKDIIQEGAVYWGLDRSYQEELDEIPTAPVQTWPFSASRRN